LESERLPRKLVAVLYADVAGYSRLTEADEDATHRRLRADLDHFAGTIGACRGHVVHYAGDAILATFESAVDALTCAARAQEEFSRRNTDLPDERQVRFRIGLNLGDVIEDRGDVYGDGVNVAARLEGLAEPGGICISGSFHDAIGARLPFNYDFLGEQQVKNIRKPVRAYRATLHPGAEIPAIPIVALASRPARSWLRPAAGGVVAAVVIALASGAGVWYARTLPHEPEPAGGEIVDTAKLPRVAVLPFVNVGNDARQEYFADGVTEDIMTDLSGLSGMIVIARSASSRYRGKQVVPQDAGRELGADYLLEGSVRRDGDMVRVTARLVKTVDGTQSWAERYDRQLDGLFALQDDVTHKIVKAMAIRLTPREEKNLGRMGAASFEAYDLFLQGQRLYGERSREASEAAIAAYRHAIELDPGFARAYGAIAVTLSFAYRSNWTDYPEATRDRALVMAQRAVELEPESPQAFWALGYTHLFRHEYEQAADAVRRSIALAPNYADGYGLLAFIRNHQGKAQEAAELIRKGMALNPHYSFDYPWNLGWAYYTMENYPEAIAALKQAVERNEFIDYPRLFLAASYVGQGQIGDGQWEIEQLRVIAPALTLSTIRSRFPSYGVANLNRLQAHLREAGLSE